MSTLALSEKKKRVHVDFKKRGKRNEDRTFVDGKKEKRKKKTSKRNLYRGDFQHFFLMWGGGGKKKKKTPTSLKKKINDQGGGGKRPQSAEEKKGQQTFLCRWNMNAQVKEGKKKPQSSVCQARGKEEEIPFTQKKINFLLQEKEERGPHSPSNYCVHGKKQSQGGKGMGKNPL